MVSFEPALGSYADVLSILQPRPIKIIVRDRNDQLRSKKHCRKLEAAFYSPISVVTRKILPALATS